MSLDRADELLADLKQEYEKSLQQQNVSERSVHLTHEVLERLRSVFDRISRSYWETYIAPHISDDDRKRALIYFPIADDQQSFDSTMGRWRWKTVAADHDKLRDHLIALQPFSNPANTWLATMNSIAQQGKHIDLVPQKRTEEQRITVSRGGGSVSWGPGVTFGSGVSVMGVPINPLTQRIMPTPGVTESIVRWVSFEMEGYRVNALGFCIDACKKTRSICEKFADQFDL